METGEGVGFEASVALLSVKLLVLYLMCQTWVLYWIVLVTEIVSLAKLSLSYSHSYGLSLVVVCKSLRSVYWLLLA